ncbi:TonB-dependent receptor [Arenicella sp. 4NH20-0111]|uniref:TonB-dependent receptor domain-containing protein n=1 Tax=Arenicella sp. 4NH20-0111 TaxID=3127648 RepID=UPI003104E6BE
MPPSHEKNTPFKKGSVAAFISAAIALPLVTVISAPVLAQAEATQALEEVVVTGSRIRRNPLAEASPVINVDLEQLDQSGLTNIGQALQQLPITGSAVNSRFNVPGNSGFPQDGSGIGAGATQLALRNVNAKRTLVLVDGRRWVAGASASGVPSTVDLNTIPANMVERIEILQGGASAVYGSDAISGVVNIITNSKFEGLSFDAQIGQYLSEGDGEDKEFSVLWGGGNDRTHVVVSASYNEEGGVFTADRAVSAFPVANTTSCDVSGTRCSSFTPQGRFILGPNFGFQDMTLNTGALNDGAGNVPTFVAGDPNGGDFHSFSAADRFNYNGQEFNYLRTPNERINLYTHIEHQLSDTLDAFVKVSYTKRESDTRGAPEPLCLGNECGTDITNNFFISRLNPFNPFGVDLSVANGNLEFFGRRPIESGPRLFSQEAETLFLSAGLEGEFELSDRTLYWDATLSYGDNQGEQSKQNSHNAANLQIALGDPAVCAATPGCVPFNFFGGQGPDGSGSFTQEMLDFVTYTQRDSSEQTLLDFAFNITGDLATLPAGSLGFAAGLEYRDQEGRFNADPIAERAETAGIPAGSTVGEFDVTEVYGELNIPLVAEASFAKLLEANIAVRYSDYSTSGDESTYKAGLLWQVSDSVSVRSTLSTGFRAPGIGELFGGAAREDFTFTDPCSDYLGQLGSSNGGRDSAQTQSVIDACRSLGVPEGLAQTNPQLSARSAGNSSLKAETSDSLTFGVVFSPDVEWASSLTFTADYYDLEIEDAVQGRSPGDLITACVNTGSPEFCNAVQRTSSGRISLVDNQLQNIGAIESSGYDLGINYASNDTSLGLFNARVNATLLDEYVERIPNPDGSETVNDRTGTHTSETFERAFPELRLTSTLGWRSTSDRWNGSLTFRYVDEMETSNNETLDSALFTDLQVSYVPPIADDALTVTLGFNNVFDEEPPVLNTSLVGVSLVSHDIPGTVGYLRFRYQPK